MPNQNHIAIFIDAENLTKWIKNDGVQSLMEELLPLGQIVVRKAYGKWSESQLAPFQSVLNENGFELIHTFHPVSGKNSTDIKMTVDTMEVALDSQVQWIVLATGDSDFSPLFRKLREQGKEVIGVGPKSPLSECVKNSCSRYVYTDAAIVSPESSLDSESTGETDVKADSSVLSRVSECIDYMEIMEKILQQEDNPILLSSLKPRILLVDNAFSEKRLGFKNFKDFVESADFAEMIDMGGGAYSVAYVDKSVIQSDDVQMTLAKVLKKKKWDIIPRDLLKKVFHHASEITKDEPMTKQVIVQEIAQKNIPGTTSSLINHSLSVFFKSHLVQTTYGDGIFWQLPKDPQYWQKIDLAMLDRLGAGLKEENIHVESMAVLPLLYAKYAEVEALKLVESKLNG